MAPSLKIGLSQDRQTREYGDLGGSQADLSTVSRIDPMYYSELASMSSPIIASYPPSPLNTTHSSRRQPGMLAVY
jgi:hypothetical protein